MLLDVNNVYVNSRNHGFDAREFIRQLPLHRVGQIHMAGHFDRGDVIVDTHEGPIIDPVWDLYKFTIEAIGRPVSTLIEWDTNVPELKTVVAEATRAQGIIRGFGFEPSPALRAPSPRVGEGCRQPFGDWGEGEFLSRLTERREAVGV